MWSRAGFFSSRSMPDTLPDDPGAQRQSLLRDAAPGAELATVLAEGGSARQSSQRESGPAGADAPVFVPDWPSD